MQTDLRKPTPAVASGNGGAPILPERPASETVRPWWRKRRAVAGAALLVVAGVALIVSGAAGVGPFAQTPAPAPTATAPKYDARGVIAPVRRARVLALQGGVVRNVYQAAGDSVLQGEELVSLEQPDGSWAGLRAPLAGTVLSLPVQLGDSVLPGGSVAVVGDLSALVVETTDVDEYLISRLKMDQALDVSVDALPDRTFQGRVVSIALLPELGSGGDQQYPVKIALEGADPRLRPGMTARIRLRGQ